MLALFALTLAALSVFRHQGWAALVFGTAAAPALLAATVSITSMLRTARKNQSTFWRVALVVAKVTAALIIVGIGLGWIR